MIKTVTAALVALGLTTGVATAAGEAGHVTDYDFSFEGPFGTYDTNQLQRGLQVYTEVCAACHGLEFVAFRTLSQAGGPELPEDQMRAFAAQFEVFDPSLFDGEGDFRPAIATDYFPGSALTTAPDLSLMAKARAGFHGPMGTGLSQLFNGMGGAEYIASVLAGYTGEDKTEAGATLYVNSAFPGGYIAMAPPLFDGAVEFADGADNDVESLSQDVAAFLMWSAEPKMMQRKQAGFTGVIMLSLLAVLLYLTNKRLWAPIKNRAKETAGE